MQHLTMKEILISGRRYIRAGKLQAQDCQRRNCVASACKNITENGHRCIIGSALNKKTIEYLLNEGKDGYSISGLVDKGYVDISPVELQDAVRLQSAHDSWTSKGKTYKAAFYKLFREMEIKYLGATPRTPSHL